MEKQIVWKEKNINYDISGKGPAVVLIHGFLESHHTWDGLKKAFENLFTVLSIDLPGFGKSAVYGKSHSMAFMAESVNAVMNNEKIDHAVLVGHSMGGYVAAAFAEQYPKKLKGLVFFHSHAGADSPEAKQNRLRAIEAVKNGHKNYINKFIPDLFAEENREILKPTIEALCKEAESISAEGIIAAIRGMTERKDYRQLLENINVPVLFVVGKKDSRIPLDFITKQMQLPKDSEAIIVDNVGHMGQFENPDMIFPVLESFCERAHQK